MSIPSFILIGHCVSELHGHLCPYRNVWPEAVYCCFIYKKYNVYRIDYMLVSSELLVSITLPSFVYLHLQVFEIAKCIA